MSFEEAGLKYAELRQQFEQSTITQQEFERRVSELVVVGPDGVSWRLEPHTGTWIQAGAPQDAIPVKKKKEQKPPETLFQLAVLIFKTLISNLPKTIILALFMAALTWVAHTYLIAKVNNGLMYNAGANVLNAMVNWQRANFPGVEAFWGLLSYFLSNSFGRIFTAGIFNWVKGFLMLPAYITQSFLKIKIKSLHFLFFGIIAALLASYFIKNFMVSWVLALGILLTMTARFQSMEALVLRLMLSDIQRLFRARFLNQEIQSDGIYITLLGLSAGFAIAGFWRTKLTYTFVTFWVFLALFIALLFLLKRKEARQVLLFLLVITGGIFLYYLPVLAVCQGGNVSGTGGNWLKWWGMRGADTVRKMGVMPAASSFLGGLLGGASAISSNIASTLGSILSGPTKPIPAPTVTKKPAATPSTPTDQQKLERIRKINEEVRELEEEAGKMRGLWGTFKGTLSNGKEDVVDTAKSAVNTVVDLTKKAVGVVVEEAKKAAYQKPEDIFKNPSIVSNALTSGLNKVKNTAEDAFNSVIGVVKGVYYNPSIITDTLKGMANTTGNIVKGVGKAIYNTVTDPKKMAGILRDFLKEAVGFDNFKNSLDPNRSLGSRIGQVLIGTGKVGMTLFTLGIGTAKTQAAKAAVTAAKTGLTTGGKVVVGGAVKTGAKTGAKTAAGQTAKSQAANTAKQASNASRRTFTPAGKLPKLTGMTQKETSAIQRGANKLGLEVKVRPPSFEGQPWIGRGIPKPVTLKNKTLGTIDNLIGAKGPPGVIGSYKPDKNMTRNLIHNIKSNPGIPQSRKDQMIREVMNTYKQRYREFSQNQSHLQQLINQNKINIKNGVIFDAKTGKPFIPDVDVFSITKVGGGPASASEKAAYFQYLKSQGVRVEHGAHLDWRPTDSKGLGIFNKIVKGHGKGGEALIHFGPKGISGQYYTP